MSKREHRMRRCNATTMSAVMLLMAGLLLFSLVSPAQAVAPSLVLSVRGATNNTVSLSWVLSVPGGWLRYSWVEYGVVDSTTKSSKTVGTATSTVVSGLTPGTLYWFQVKSSTTSGLVTSNTVTKKTTGTAPPPPQPAIPAAPSGLSAAAVSPSSIDLHWTDNASNETGFKVEQAAADGGPYTQIATVDADTTGFSVTGLDESTTFFFRVRAWNGGGDSVYSNTASATTPATVPIAPSGLTAVAVSPSRIDLRWTDNSFNEDGFVIERGASEAGPFTQLGPVGPGTTAYSDTGLAESTTYCYRVYARNSAGTSACTNTASGSTPASIPISPSGLTATSVSTSRIDLRWVDNSFNETGFRIERSADGVSFAEIAPVGVGATFYSNTELTASTTYHYRVRAINSAGNSGYSNAVSAKTKSAPPTAPSNLTASAVTSSRIDLRWNDNSSDETGFQVERGPTPAGPWTTIATPSAGVTGYSNIGLSDSTTYYYRVCATSTIAGNSPYSNTASATTQGTAPNSPSNLSASAVSTSRVDLSWSDNSGNETAFKVLRTDPEARVATFILPPNSTSYSDTGLSPSTTYTYQVCATNAIGSSEYTSAVSAATQSPPPMPPSAPTGPAAAAISCSEIRLSWRDTAWNEGGFIIESGTNGADLTRIAELPADTESFIHLNVNEGATYYYRICAVNDDGQSDFTTAVYATTKLKAPTNLRASAVSPNRVDLTWTDNSAREAHYVLERSTQSASGPWEPPITLPADTSSYSDQTCQPYSAYYYRVFATGSISDPSNVASVVTPEVPVEAHWIGKTPVIGEGYWVAMAGSIACVTSSTGLQVVDVSDPSNPLVVGSTALTYPYDLAMDGSGYAYVGDGQSLKVIDIREPAAPAVVATLPMPDYAQGVHLSGGKAYVACYTAGVVIVDIADPAAPRLLGTVDTPGAAFAVSVAGNVAAVADANAVLVVDVSNPASGTVLGSLPTTDRAMDVEIGNGYAYVAASTAGMLVVDISSPTGPRVTGTGKPTVFGSASGVSVSGGRAYVASFSYNSTDNGLQVFDVANPALPTQKAFLAVPGRTRGGLAVEGNLACVASGTGGLSLIDVSNLAGPVQRDLMPETIQSRAVEADGSLLFALSYSSVQSRMYVFDTADPASPRQIGSVDLTYPYDVAVDGIGRAFVADGKSLKVVDVQDPSAPVALATLPMPDYALGVHISGQRVYVACYMAGVTIVDVSNPYAPRTLGTVDTPGAAFAVSVSGNIAMVADGGSMLAVDVSNPASAVILGSLATSDRAVDVDVENGYAYVAAGTAGVLVVDISSPGNLRLAGTGRPTVFGSASGISVSGGRAFVASFSYNTTDNGLQVFDIANPAQPLQTAFLQSPGRYCKGVAVSGRNAYLTDDRYLIQIAGF